MKDLTQGSVTKHLLHMSAFLTASMLVQTLYLLIFIGLDTLEKKRLRRSVWLAIS